MIDKEKILKEARALNHVRTPHDVARLLCENMLKRRERLSPDTDPDERLAVENAAKAAEWMLTLDANGFAGLLTMFSTLGAVEPGFIRTLAMTAAMRRQQIEGLINQLGITDADVESVGEQNDRGPAILINPRTKVFHFAAPAVEAAYGEAPYPDPTGDVFDEGWAGFEAGIKNMIATKPANAQDPQDQANEEVLNVVVKSAMHLRAAASIVRICMLNNPALATIFMRVLMPVALMMQAELLEQQAAEEKGAA